MQEEKAVQNDERIVWVRAKPGRRLVLTVDPTPSGFSVTTQWLERGEVVRQDCEVSIREGMPAGGGAASL
jgi:hypothetical protein